MAKTKQRSIPPIEELKSRKIGRILTKMGVVNRNQVSEALEHQKQRRMPLGELLIDLGYASQEDVSMALAAQAGMAMIDLDGITVPSDIISMVPAEMAQTYQMVPVKHNKTSNTLTVVLKSADNFRAVDDLRLLLGFNVEPTIGNAEQVDRLIGQLYGADDESLTSLIDDLASDAKLEELKDRGESIDLETLVEAAEDNKVKRLLNLVLLQAIKDRSSDIHFEPFEDEFKMRYRIDGVLYDMIPPPKHLGIPIVSRIKVMANLDIAERRLPQDGRIELTVGSNPIDLRVSVLPTMFGESIVMRVLDRSNVQLDLDKIGLRNDDLDLISQLIKKPNGIVIVTGPTGSGKTTTLYAALSTLNTTDVKILTAEDPVEYDIDGLCQVQILPDMGLTFAAALRSFLRQDPDTILVGETRDLETAQIAVQASLTGHLVFTTLHTNDAPSTIARLLDLGLEPFLVTATLEGIVAQRLVRRICANCKETYEPTEQQLMELQLTPEDLAGKTLYRGQGCEACNHSGYKGRMAIFEIMLLDDELRNLIMQRASTQAIRTNSRKRGMRTLHQSGMLAIYDGQTTIDEVVRETVLED